MIVTKQTPGSPRGFLLPFHRRYAPMNLLCVQGERIMEAIYFSGDKIQFCSAMQINNCHPKKELCDNWWKP